MANTSINAQKGQQPAFNNSAFRSSFTSKEGHVPARVVQCRVVNSSMKNWTVDVISLFDRHRYYNIQVCSPYLHHSNGEGISCFPEVGARCLVVLPSDSQQPFILTFMMAFQKIDDATAPDAPHGTTSHGGQVPHPSEATFAGGRPTPKPGDMWWRGRDGQFIILHRGGVLQIGATELAQRIFIPLDNRVLDISENYAHHNVGGSVVWGLQDGAGQTNFPTQMQEMFRVFANDKYADIRVTRGKVPAPMSGEGGLEGDVIYEIAISPKGFNADSGDAVSGGTEKGIVFHFGLDRKGNGTMTVAGKLTGRIKKAVRLTLDDTFQLSVAKSGSITAKDGFDLDGGKYTHIKGDIVRLGKGDQAVARKGDFVSTKVAIPVKAIVIPSGPVSPGVPVACMVSFIDSLGGVITTGNDKVRA